MDELDKYIIDIVNKEISEPIKYNNTIKRALKVDKKKASTISIVKKIAVVLICITTIGGVVFANVVREITKKKSSYINQNNDYVQNLNMQYNTIDNLSIKIKSILIDDFNIELNIEYLYTEPITSAESKIVIRDENQNIIYSDNETINYYRDIFKKNERYKYGNTRIIEDYGEEDDKKTEQNPIRFQSSYQNIEDNILSRKINLYSDLDSKKFPKTKKLYIQLENIVLRDNSKVVKSLERKWDFNIELDKKFLNRETNMYIQEDINISKQNFTVLRAEESNVQFKIKIKYNGNEDLNKLINTLDLDNIQIFDEKNNQYINAETIDILENSIIKAEYNINRNNLSNILTIKIGDFNKIKIIKK